MKYYESTFEDYLQECYNCNFHPKLLDYYKKIDKNSSNLILYGPSGSGKYTQALCYLSDISTTNLKYEKKMCVVYNKCDYFYKISDVHIEIDVSLLGCNAKSLWNEIYNQIVDIANTKPNNCFTILCKNFNEIHNELLHTFYSYMQTIETTKINYILLTEKLAYIPYNILDRCNIISVPKPTQQIMKKKFGNITLTNNIKSCYNNLNLINNKKLCKNVLDSIQVEKNFTYLRESLYNILIYNQDEGDCIYEIVKILLANDKEIMDVHYKIYDFFKLYNNNYRPIYHLEKLILTLVE